MLLALPLATAAQTGSVGIGTTTPDAKAVLDVSSTDKGLLIPRLTPAARRTISAPPQGMLVFQSGNAATATDSVGIWYATGQGRRWLYLPDAQNGATVQAANGLTKTGNTVALGGALTAPTTALEIGSNELRLTSSGAASITLDQQQNAFTGSATLNAPQWQSFTVGRSGLLTRVDVYLAVSNVGNLVLTLHSGEGTGAPALATVPFSTTTLNFVMMTVVLPTPLPVVAGQQYTLGLSQSSGLHNWRRSVSNPYGGGRASTASTHDMGFATYVNTPQGLTLSSGQVRLTGLSGPALLNVGADGTVGTQPVSSVADNLGNHTATQNLNLGANLLVGNGGTSGLGLTASGQVRIGSVLSLASDDRLGIDGGNLRVGGRLWGSAADDRTLRFGDGNFVTIGESGADDQMVLRAGRFDFRVGDVNIASNLDVNGSLGVGTVTLFNTYTMSGNAWQGFAISCPNGTRLIGGGGGHRDNNSAQQDITVNYSGPRPGSENSVWQLNVENDSGSSRAIRIYCICARVR